MDSTDSSCVSEMAEDCWYDLIPWSFLSHVISPLSVRHCQF